MALGKHAKWPPAEVTSGKLVVRKGTKKLYHLCAATSVTTKKYPLNDEIKRENLVGIYPSFFAIRSSHSLIPQTKKDLATRSGTKVVDGGIQPT